MSHRILSLGFGLFLVLVASPVVGAEELPIVRGVEAQPLKAQVRRVVETLDYLGEPLTADQSAALD
jgi:hypothetical protein